MKEFFADFGDVCDKTLMFLDELTCALLAGILMLLCGLFAAAVLAVPFVAYCIYRLIRCIFRCAAEGHRQMEF